MPVYAWLLVVFAVGVLLVIGSGRATASVTRGPVFVRWMLLVFAAFLALASIPILAGG